MDSTNESVSAGQGGGGNSVAPTSQLSSQRGGSPPSGNGNGNGHGPKNIKKIARIVVILLVIAGVVTFFLLRNKPEGKPGWLRVSGRLEGYETNVGAKIAGRVESISSREGELVERGQLLVKLSDEDIQAQLRGAKARYAQAEESIKEAEAQLAASREQVEQAKLNVSQAKVDAQGRIQQAQANVASQQAEYAQAEAQEAQAKAEYELAKIRIKRYDELVVQGAVTQDEADQAHSTFKSAGATLNARRAAVASAAKQIAAAQAALTQAKSNALNPPIRFSQQQSDVKTVAQNEAAVARAKLELHNAKASIDEIQSNIDYLTIRSPIRGIVTARTVEPGAVVAAGQTVISLINLDTIFMRAYVPDNQAPQVRVNQTALIYYDSEPKKEIHGKVIEIDPTASFTPENIYFKEDRVKQVFGIKILIDNPDNFAKPGMPADADIDISPSSGAKNS
ncbi:MAG: efflux RND transporter periplasmic adaptor subunit [Candidatus Obscuribacterales bacterium]